MQRGPLSIIFVFVIVELLGFSLVLPLLPYYATAFQATPFVIGLLGTSNALAQFLGAPLLGRLSDRFGRRPLLIVAVTASLAGFLLLGFARSLAMLFASRIIDGFLGGNIAMAQAYITDLTDEKNRARGLGIIGAAFGIGFVIGPALGGFLSRWGYEVPAFAAAGLSALNLIWILAALPESLTAERRKAMAMNPRPPVTAGAMFAALRRPCVGPLLITTLFYALAFGVFTSSFSLVALTRLGLAAQSTGYVLAYVGVLSVLVQGLAVGRLARRFAEKTMIFAGALIMSGMLLAWGFTGSVPLLVVVLAPLSLAAGVLNTVLPSALTKAVSPDEIGGTLGLNTGMQSLSNVVAPVLGGLLLQRLGAWSLGALGALIMAGMGLFVWLRIAGPRAPNPQGCAPATDPTTGIESGFFTTSDV